MQQSIVVRDDPTGRFHVVRITLNNHMNLKPSRRLWLLLLVALSEAITSGRLAAQDEWLTTSHPALTAPQPVYYAPAVGAAARPIHYAPPEPMAATNAAEASHLLPAPTTNTAAHLAQPAAPPPGPWQVGDYKVVPYGVLWGDMIYATSRTSPGAFTLFVPSPEVEGEPAFTIDARRTRLGLNVTGPEVPIFGGAASGGQVELDFFGQFILENQASLQIRHAFWEAKNDQWRMLVGQTWDVISPLMPGTLNYSVGWMGGNVGFRRPQFRWERYMDFSPTLWGIWQISLNHDIVPDFSANTTVDREATSWPVVESRLGWKLGDRGPDGLPIEMGISGHLGQTQFDFNGNGPPPVGMPPSDDQAFLSWSFNVDVKVPLTDYWGVQGEYVVGANLSPYLGGIGQGVCGCTRTAVRSHGGWVDTWYRWGPKWRSSFGGGIDDPNNRDLAFGRSYNSFVFGNLVHELTKKFSMGLEVTHWKTSYIEQRTGQIPDSQLGPTEQANAWVFEWMCQYAF